MPVTLGLVLWALPGVVVGQPARSLAVPAWRHAATSAARAFASLVGRAGDDKIILQGGGGGGGSCQHLSFFFVVLNGVKVVVQLQ